MPRTRSSVDSAVDLSTGSLGESRESSHREPQRESHDESPSTVRRAFKMDLYYLQQRAPKPICVACQEPLSGLVPAYYGPEFHGMLDRERAGELLLAAGDGSYLVRESQRFPKNYTLCMCFDGAILNYRLYFDGAHFVGEKRFDYISDLVSDGLISMFIAKYAGDYVSKMTEEAVYEESPYSQYLATTMNRRERKAEGSEMRLSQCSSRASFVDGPDSDLPTLLQEKAHRFKAHTFRVAHYCDYCRNFMWGLVQQGLRCEDCGFAAHKKCSERTRLDCQPHLRYVKRVFAVDLDTLCMAHRITVPPVVEHCIREVERRGLEVEGLYRVSGSHEDVLKLRSLYDTQAHRGGDWLAGRLSRVDDIHTVASLHKLYLRVLPLPLIPLGVCRSLLDVIRTPPNETRLERTREVLSTQLTQPFYATLKLLLSHLFKVAERSPVNKMSAENLGRIFAPTLLCAASPQSQPGLPATGQQDQQLLVFLIKHQILLFL